MADKPKKEIKFCKSCFTPMHEPNHFAREDFESRYCKWCCDENGELKCKTDIKRQMVTYCIDVKKMGEKEAKDFVKAQMHKLPEWRKC